MSPEVTDFSRKTDAQTAAELAANTAAIRPNDETEITFETIFEPIKNELAQCFAQLKAAKVDLDDLTLRETLEDLKRLSLSQQPIIDSSRFSEALALVESQKNLKFSWVETNKVIGRPFARDYDDGWAHEYHSRQGRTVDIAMSLLQGVRESEDNFIKQAIEHVFHPNKPHERIKVLALYGPSGPIYLVEDGTHRVAAAKLLGLSRIPVDVVNITYPLTQTTYEAETSQYWQKLIELGLIEGSISVFGTEVGKPCYKILVLQELLPWIRVSGQARFLQINKIYEQIYPGSLEGLAMPRDALLDPVANNHFLAGKEMWEKW